MTIAGCILNKYCGIEAYFENEITTFACPGGNGKEKEG